MKQLFFSAKIASVFLFIIFCESCKPFVKKACDYPVIGYKLSQNKNGKWAIIKPNSDMVLGYSIRYRTYGFYDFDDAEAMTFNDSCRAKGLLKKYNEYQDRNSFK